MEFPHHHHSHHHRRDDDEDDGAGYPPPGTRPPFSGPPPPHFNHPPPVHHSYHDGPPPPQPPVFEFEPPYPPPPVNHTHHPHFPSVVHHHSHEPDPDSRFLNKPTFKVFAKANPDYSLTVRDGRVVLARSDPSDPAQHWFKDEKYSTRVKDEEGSPCFSLVNKATGLAMKHSAGASHPVQLMPYDPEKFEESVLWTQSKEFGDGYRAIRMVNNVHLNVDAFHGDAYSGGVHDGTTIVLWKWKKGDNQLWRIVPYCKSHSWA